MMAFVPFADGEIRLRSESDKTTFGGLGEYIDNKDCKLSVLKRPTLVFLLERRAIRQDKMSEWITGSIDSEQKDKNLSQKGNHKFES